MSLYISLTWCLTDVNSFPGTYVAFSLQSGTAKSWHSTWAKYSHTEKGNGFNHSWSMDFKHHEKQKKYLLMQCTAGVSSNRLRQTVQNFLLWWVGSDQQCATGFLIIQGAIPEQGVMTFVTHLSCTMKLQTENRKENLFNLFVHSDGYRKGYQSRTLAICKKEILLQ